MRKWGDGSFYCSKEITNDTVDLENIAGLFGTERSAGSLPGRTIQRGGV